MEQKYEVTIGIPVYNVERYIRLTMDSALAQTFQSIEFLICDDCGTDSSMDIICEYQQTHPRGNDIHILHQPRNMGVSAARNRIIDVAGGNFLYFMDADDSIEPNTISLLMDHQQSIDADIVFGSYDKIETYNNNRLSDTIQYPFLHLTEEDALGMFAFRKYGGIQSSACNYLVSVNLLRKENLKFIDSHYWEDMAFTFDVVTRCKNAVLLPDITYHYLCRYDSLSNYQKRDTICKAEIQHNIDTIDYMKEHCKSLSNKPYYSGCCYQVVMTDFYILCHIEKNYKILDKRFSPLEIKAVLRHPAKLGEILSFKQKRFENFLLFFLSKLPGFMIRWCIKLWVKLKSMYYRKRN